MKQGIIFILLLGLGFSQESNFNIDKILKIFKTEPSKNTELFIDTNWNDDAKNIFYQTNKISPEDAFNYQLKSIVPFSNLGLVSNAFNNPSDRLPLILGRLSQLSCHLSDHTTFLSLVS